MDKVHSLILLIFAGLVGLDLAIKRWASMHIETTKNFGIIMGQGADQSALLRTGLVSALGFIFISFYFHCLYFFRLTQVNLKIGLTFYFAGVTSNTLERIFFGYVTDFININGYIFNLADVWILVGLGLTLIYLPKEMSLKLPDGNRRSLLPKTEKWEKRVLFKQATLLFMFAFFMYLISLSFLKVLLPLGEIFTPFSLIYWGGSLFLGTCLFLIMFSMLKRVSGPFKAFDSHIDNLLSGKRSELKLRQDDHFQDVATKLNQITKGSGNEN
jgi:lipoprotein signal peptidase